MDRTNQSSPPGSSPPPPGSRQNKASSQKEYRKEEGDSFNALRDAIKNLTGEEPRTRLEILRKAIDLVASLSGTENRSNAQTTLIIYEAPAPSAYSGSSYPDQSPHWTQPCPSDAELNTPAYSGYLPRYPSYQQTFDQSSRPVYTGSSSSNYLQF